jgi:hypothetical protein
LLGLVLRLGRTEARIIELRITVYVKQVHRQRRGSAKHREQRDQNAKNHLLSPLRTFLLPSVKRRFLANTRIRFRLCPV